MGAAAFLLFGLAFTLASGRFQFGGDSAVPCRYDAPDFFLTTGNVSTMGAFPDGS